MRRQYTGCALELPRRLKEIRKWPIPDWLLPAIDQADKEIAYYRAHGGN